MDKLTGNWPVHTQRPTHVTMDAQIDGPQDPSIDWMTEQLALVQDAGVSESHQSVRRSSVNSRVMPQQALTYGEGVTRTPSDSLRSPFRPFPPIPPTPQHMDDVNDINDISWFDYRQDNSSQKFMIEVASLKQELGTVKCDLKALRSQYAEEARLNKSVPVMVEYVKSLSQWFVQSKSGLDHGMSEITAAMERIREMIRGHEETEVEDGGHVGHGDHD